VLTPNYDHGYEVQRIAERSDSERISRIRDAWSAYYGDSPDPLRVREGEINDNVKLNYARLIVDSGVAHLFGSELMITAPINKEASQQTIDEIIRANGGGLLWQRLGMSGSIGGTMFYKLIPRDNAPCRIVCIDPATVDVEWMPDDYEEVYEYKISWMAEDESSDRFIARRQIIQRDGNTWMITEQAAIDGGWRTISETPWLYDFAPIGYCQNLPSPHEFYGISDLEPDVLALCLSIERVASNINRIVRLYAHPRTWGRMIGDALNIDANPGAVLRLEHPQAELRNLEMQSDLASSIDLYRRLVAALHETTRIPEVATGKLDSAGQLSSLALRILYAPLIQKTESKRRTYGQAIVEMMRRAIALSGGDAETIVDIGWSPLIPADPEAERRSAMIDKQLGVSSTTLIERLGYDPEFEMQQRQFEDAAAAEAQQRSFNAGNAAMM
jgi:hypothetical protein